MQFWKCREVRWAYDCTSSCLCKQNKRWMRHSSRVDSNEEQLLSYPIHGWGELNAERHRGHLWVYLQGSSLVPSNEKPWPIWLKWTEKISWLLETMVCNCCLVHALWPSCALNLDFPLTLLCLDAVLTSCLEPWQSIDFIMHWLLGLCVDFLMPWTYWFYIDFFGLQTHGLVFNSVMLQSLRVGMIYLDNVFPTPFPMP